MSKTVINKHIATSTGGYAASDLQPGEIGINYLDGAEAIYIKNSVDNIISFATSANVHNTITVVKDEILNKPGEFYPGSTSGEVFNNYSTNVASGWFSHAEGHNNKAIGEMSHAEGINTRAEGLYSHTEGISSHTVNEASHAEGSATTAVGIASHAEGNKTTANGNYSHAEGWNTIASGRSSHAEGYYTKASGHCSHSEGNNTIAIGDSSHAEGWASRASGHCSHSEGYSTKANGHYSHAEGSYTTAIGSYSHAEGYSTKANGHYSHAEGSNTKANGNYSHAEGSNTKANGNYSHAEGQTTIASGGSSHAEGANTTASGNFSHAEGGGTTANGDYSHAEGYSTTASGNFSHAEGGGTTANGDYSHAEGYSTTASGYCSHAGGLSSSANGEASFSQGEYLLSQNEGEAALGVRNSSVFSSMLEGDLTARATLFSVGMGLDGTARNAMELKYNGDLYLYGAGNYNGRNSLGNAAYDSTVQTVQSLLGGGSTVMPSGNKALVCNTSATALTKTVTDSSVNVEEGTIVNVLFKQGASASSVSSRLSLTVNGVSGLMTTSVDLFDASYRYIPPYISPNSILSFAYVNGYWLLIGNPIIAIIEKYSNPFYYSCFVRANRYVTYFINQLNKYSSGPKTFTYPIPFSSLNYMTVLATTYSATATTVSSPAVVIFDGNLTNSVTVDFESQASDSGMGSFIVTGRI